MMGLFFLNVVPTHFVDDQTFKIKHTLFVSCSSQRDALQTLTEVELTQLNLATKHATTHEYVIHNIQYVIQPPHTYYSI